MLSYLGLGVQPPTPSWGNILNEGRVALGVAGRRELGQPAAAREAEARHDGIVVHEQRAHLPPREGAQRRLDAVGRPAVLAQRRQLADCLGGRGLRGFGEQLHRAVADLGRAHLLRRELEHAEHLVAHLGAEVRQQRVGVHADPAHDQAVERLGAEGAAHRVGDPGQVAVLLLADPVVEPVLADTRPRVAVGMEAARTHGPRRDEPIHLLDAVQSDLEQPGRLPVRDRDEQAAAQLREGDQLAHHGRPVHHDAAPEHVRQPHGLEEPRAGEHRDAAAADQVRRMAKEVLDLRERARYVS